MGLLVACGQGSQVAQPSMNLTSSVFNSGGMIPSKYTCSGQDVSPSLAWTGVPDSARSLALTVIDPDAPGGAFVHWVLFNIPVHTDGLDEGSVPGGSRQGRNDFGSTGYRGPCPPRGAPHHYHFKLHALSDQLALPEGATERDFESAVKGKTIGSAELVGLFSR